MKKIMFVLMLMLAALAATAQIEKDNVLVGGNFGLDVNSPREGGTVATLNLMHNYGIFVSDNTAVGYGLGFAMSTSDDFTTTALSFGPSVRYYFVRKDASSDAPFLLGTVAYERTSFSNGTNVSDNGLRAVAGVGYDIFLNRHVALEGLAFYNYGTINESNDFGLSFGFQVFIDR